MQFEGRILTRIFGYKGKTGSGQHSFLRTSLDSSTPSENPRSATSYTYRRVVGQTGASIIEALIAMPQLSGERGNPIHGEKSRRQTLSLTSAIFRKYKTHVPCWQISKTPRRHFLEIFQANNSGQPPERGPHPRRITHHYSIYRNGDRKTPRHGPPFWPLPFAHLRAFSREHLAVEMFPGPFGFCFLPAVFDITLRSR